MTTLSETFRKEAGTVWNRMRKAARVGLSLSEETITESALYNIALAHQGNGIVISLQTRQAEHRHGADWEWWIVRGNRGVGFRVQAKRLFREGDYRYLLKSGGARYQQLDTLVRESAREQLVPLYCFFNFDHRDLRPARTNACNHDYRGRSFWGCALAFPAEIRHANSNTIADLQPLMRPWHQLVCQSGQADLLDAAIRFAQDGVPTGASQPRHLPSRVWRLIEPPQFAAEGTYLDDQNAEGKGDIPSGVCGLMIIHDMRDQDR
jgi:hypothetical protein